MAHLDDEQLSLLALGEDLGKDAGVHISQCRACAETLKSLQRTVLVATTDPNTVQLDAPGSHNWSAIHAALELSPSLAADPLSAASASGSGTAVSDDAASGVSDAGTSRSGSGKSGSGTSALEAPTPLRSSRKQPGARRGPWILGVAAGTAAGLVIGAWTAASILGPADPPITAPTTSAPTAGPSTVLLAEASLQPLASHSASGEASVQRLADGTRQLVIRLPDEPLSGFREVWVGSSDLSRMVSLGVLGDQAGVFVIPSGLDLGQYPVVDISNEPYDGVPAHSADSIARGVLTQQS
jgi:Anti-sigma-K factor rskA